MARPLNFAVNTSGATYERITARLVPPGDTAPLWQWSKTTGGVER